MSPVKAIVAIHLSMTLMTSNAFAETVLCATTQLNEKAQTGLVFTLKSLQGMKLSANGPNCWSAALLAKGLLNTPRPVTKPEFWHWMNSKYCRALAPDEPAELGDIASLFSPQVDGNYHSFLRLDDDTAFSKNSPSMDDKYEIQPFENMFYPAYREISGTCRGTEGHLRAQNCPFEIVHHRCRAIETDFYSRVKEIAPTVEAVDQLETKLVRMMSRKSQPTVQQLNPIFEELGTHLRKLRALTLRDHDEFARKSLEHRVIGLLHTKFPSITSGLSQATLQAGELAMDIQTKERDHVPRNASAVRRSGGGDGVQNHL